jgi:uncharacterized integral membrane protein (TIGR00697 family)
VAISIVSALYIAAQILADIASLRIVLWMGMSIDAGTFIYPFTFTLRDLVHKVAGIKTARTLIIVAALVNLAMAGLFWFASMLPADPMAGEQLEFVHVLAPVWRIVIASILAEVISELLDTEAYHLWVTRITKRYQWMRILLSNAISVPVDSLVFCWGAFGGTMPVSTVWAIVLSNVLIKSTVTLVSLPGIYLVRGND